MLVCGTIPRSRSAEAGVRNWLGLTHLTNEQFVRLSVAVSPAIDFMNEAATVDLCKNDLRHSHV